MIAVITALVAVVDVALLTGVYLLLRRGIRFRSMGIRFIAWGSIAVTLLGLLFSFTAPDILLSAFLAVAAGCLVFLSGCWGAWVSDRQLAFVEKKMAERPEVKEAMERNPILRAVNRLGRWQRRE